MKSVTACRQLYTGFTQTRKQFRHFIKSVPYICYLFCPYTYVYGSVFYFIQARDTLSAENAELREQLREAKVKIHALQQHLEVIRGHTIGFILEQMNTLHIETKESQL